MSDAQTHPSRRTHLKPATTRPDGTLIRDLDPQVVRDQLTAGECPWCTRTGLRSPLIHLSHAHQVSEREARELALVNLAYRFVDEELSATLSAAHVGSDKTNLYAGRDRQRWNHHLTEAGRQTLGLVLRRIEAERDPKTAAEVLAARRERQAAIVRRRHEAAVEERICAHCTAPFEAKRRSPQRFCGNDCAHHAEHHYRPRRPHQPAEHPRGHGICVVCGREVVANWRGFIPLTCGPPCDGRYHGEVMTGARQPGSPQRLLTARGVCASCGGTVTVDIRGHLPRACSDACEKERRSAEGVRRWQRTLSAPR
jgi:hypothetical protein